MNGRKGHLALALPIAAMCFASWQFAAWQETNTTLDAHQSQLSRQGVERSRQARQMADDAADRATLEELRQNMDARKADRLHWPGMLDKLAEQLRMAQIEYEIEPSEPGEGLTKTRIKVRAILPHEAIFLRFIEALRRDSGALVILESYRLGREGEQIGMECRMRWLTLPTGVALP